MAAELQAADTKNWALRLAFAVTLGLVFEVLRGAPLPMLAPILALQIMAASRVPPGRRMIIVLVGAAAATSAVAYAVSILTVEDPGMYAIGVGLLYLWGFAMAFRKGTAVIGVLSITMTVVVTGLASESTGLAYTVVVALVISIAASFILVYLAYCLFPNRAPPPAPPKPKDDQHSRLPVALRALIATLVILPAHLYLNADGVASMVTLLTMATMLRQPGIAQSTNYCIAFVIGNGLGGLVASVTALMVTLQPDGLLLIAVTAAASLFLSWLMVRTPTWTPIILPGYVAFVVLFGLVLSPLPLADSVEVVARVSDILFGAIYAMAAVSILVPFIATLRRFIESVPSAHPRSGQ